MNNDLISREALKKAFLNHSCTEFEIKNKCRADENVIALIDNAPTVEAFTKEDMSGAYNEGYACGSRESERPQGEWIITGEEQGAFGMTYKIRKCDKCGWEHSLVIPNNFCPNCGAEMKGGAE